MIYALLPLFKEKLNTDYPDISVLVGGEVDPVENFASKAPFIWLRYAGYQAVKTTFDARATQVDIRVQASVIVRSADTINADTLSEAVTASLMAFKAGARYSAAELISGDVGAETQAGFEHIPFLFSVKTTVKGNN